MTKPICGIYKITNQINGKCYIGQSIDISRRWNQHKNNSNNPKNSCFNLPFYQALRKYGIENFSFEILEQCLKEELNDKEFSYINYFKANDPKYGYNLTPGGNNNYLSFVKITPENLFNIKNLLKNSLISQTEIAKIFNIDQTTISDINLGKIHFDDNEQYPLRDSLKLRKIKDKSCYHPCKSCGKLISKESVYCQNCYKEYRKQSSKDKYKNRNELKQLIRNNSFESLSRKFNVSGNAIRKWCQKENLPSKSSIIKNYSEDEWNKI